MNTKLPAQRIKLDEVKLSDYDICYFRHASVVLFLFVLPILPLGIIPFLSHPDWKGLIVLGLSVSGCIRFFPTRFQSQEKSFVLGLNPKGMLVRPSPLVRRYYFVAWKDVFSVRFTKAGLSIWMWVKYKPEGKQGMIPMPQLKPSVREIKEAFSRYVPIE